VSFLFERYKSRSYTIFRNDENVRIQQVEACRQPAERPSQPAPTYLLHWIEYSARECQLDRNNIQTCLERLKTQTTDETVKLMSRIYCATDGKTKTIQRMSLCGHSIGGESTKMLLPRFRPNYSPAQDPHRHQAIQ
jgi:hypothetical protein